MHFGVVMSHAGWKQCFEAALVTNNVLSLGPHHTFFEVLAVGLEGLFTCGTLLVVKH